MARSLTPLQAPPPKLTGFTGFGSNVTSSFSFASSTSSSANNVFGGPASDATRSSPSVSSSASNATKTFASFLDPTTKPVDPTPPPAPPSSNPDDATLKYYTSLRGLNNSFVTAISKAVESDPFVDIADVLEQYRRHRISVQQEFDHKSNSPPLPPKPKLAPAVPLAMPAAPMGFAGFSSAPSSSNSSTATGGGFTPSLGSTTSGKTSGFVFGNAPDSKPGSALGFTVFGSSTPAQPITSHPTPPASKSQTTPAEDALSAEKPKGFSFGSSTSDFGSKAGSAFGASSSSNSSLFGSSSIGSGTSLFSSGSTESKPAAPADQPKAAFAFAIPPTTNLFSSSSSSNSEKPTFGSPGKTSPFSFGSGSSPVTFGFGVSPKPSGEPSPSPKAGVVGFSFGALPTKTDAADPAARADTPATEGSQEDDGLSRVMSPSLAGADAEGEGEEDEDTTYTAKTKLHRLTKDAEGKPEWVDLGVGMVRYKKHRDSGARRVLLRNSSTSKILLNFNIYAGLKPTVNKKTLATMGHNGNGESSPYRLRFADEATANAAKDALEREIAFVTEHKP
ncbi:hypothetical protein FA95DRAFT_1554105 [Auriscalpium vulgare]|uniref:Uncharacterized protein n=1 Tax=Auriscalpium vulgare TaxID=40419 RepID=A0ACB8S683_9AGAM|nr:hypothetical protein FA95DRAFT_1554105 [Auriscalpium vulgare]